MGYFVAVANQRLTQEEIRSHVTSEPGCGSGAPAIRHAVRIPHFEGDSGSSKRTKRMPKGTTWRKGGRRGARTILAVWGVVVRPTGRFHLVMQIPIETFRLSNGLFVTLSEDHTAPLVAVNLWYHVGSANERPGRTGFAHLFEHMQRAGGTLNGSTWLDRTNYFETVPSNQLALALWLEADRMGRLLPAMTQQKLDTQRDVVKNERRWSMDNQPYGTWSERLPALTYPESHPFHHSLIGSMEDLSAASLEDIATFFATYYRPDNAVLSRS